MSAEKGTGAVAPLLPYDAVFRIEVSLSSQTTSVIVMRTTARLYSLEGVHSSRPRVGNAEWKSVAYGAPCIQLIRLGGGEQSTLFTIRVVIAEVESGISLWEGVVHGNSRYGAMQKNFHTFTSSDSTYAIQFVNEQEAERMLESMQDLLSQQQQMGRGSNQAQMDSQPAVFKRPTKPPRRLSKKDISSPCNFKHVSGITMQRTLSCEQELRGTIQRKMRSLSLSNLSRSKGGDDVSDDKMVGKRTNRRVKTVSRQVSKDSPDSSGEMRRTESHRMSLPSHFHQKERRPLTASSFVPPSSQLSRALSQSSGDIPNAQSSHSPQHHPLPTAARNIERRHTMKEQSHQPISHGQATPTRLNVPTRSETALNHSPVHESQQHIQHVAIASSDIVGWTTDGRLIIQVPASKRGADVSVTTVNPAPARRASTGQFAQDQVFPPLKHGSSDILAPPTQNHPQKPTSKTLQHSVSDRAIRKRPLPPTPLDIAMPISAQTLRTRPIHTTSQAAQVAVPTTVANGLATSPNKWTNDQPALAPSGVEPDQLPPPSHTHTDSMEACLQEVTDQMSQALAQFDDLLGVAQTSL